jgi:ElaB/YqjD/DUF883 family membrane-anchored ribosome-binding protein
MGEQPVTLFSTLIKNIVMKKIMLAVAGVALFAACNNSPKNEANVSQDSSRIAAQAITNYRDSLRLDSFERAEEERKIAVIREQERQKLVTASAVSASPRTTYVKGYSESVYNTQPQAQKKGWSSAAKGAAIGAGAGALTGVVVSKKDGKGALVGGLLGAGAGYVIGRQKDKKTGRAQ